MSGSPDSPVVEARRDPAAETAVRMPFSSKLPHGAAVVRWAVSEGQRVAEGDVLAEIAAYNTTMEIEAPADGAVAALLVPSGPDLIESGRAIALISPAPPALAKPEPAPAPSELELAPAVKSTVASIAGCAQPAAMSTYIEALRDGLAEEMRRDPDVFLIGESVADFGRCSGVARGLVEEFGKRRVVGTPITPAAFTGLAVGAAMAGLKPVVEFRGWSVALQAIDHIISTAAKTRYRSGGSLSVPIVLRGLNGIWPSAGAMHSASFASWFAHVPGLKVVCPATPACAKGLLKSAIRDPDPVIVLETEALYDVTGPVPESDEWLVPIGKAHVARTGEDVTIVTYGHGVSIALRAADTLAESNIHAEVLDLRSLRPIDTPSVIASVHKTGRLLTLDDGWPACSIGSEICAAVATTAFSALKAAPARIEGLDTPAPYAPNLDELALPDAREVAARALKLVRPTEV